MTEQLNVQQMAERLCAADNILVLCHKNPDGDTIGCGSALCHALKALGKTAAVLCSDAVPSRYSFTAPVPFRGEFEPKTVVAVDVASVQLFGENNGVPQYTRHVDLASTTTRATAAMRISPCWTAMRPQRQSFCMRSSARWAWRSPPHRQLPLHRPRYGHRLLPVLFHHRQHPPRGGKAHSGRCAGGGAEHPALRHQAPGADGGGAYRPQPSGISS